MKNRILQFNFSNFQTSPQLVNVCVAVAGSLFSVSSDRFEGADRKTGTPLLLLGSGRYHCFLSSLVPRREKQGSHRSSPTTRASSAHSSHRASPRSYLLFWPHCPSTALRRSRDRNCPQILSPPQSPPNPSPLAAGVARGGTRA